MNRAGNAGAADRNKIFGIHTHEPSTRDRNSLAIATRFAHITIYVHGRQHLGQEDPIRPH
jgi:hypothetical protein